ncbi:helix-turn-helix domain-containing protein [Virgibacillus flavescens]|uniref:helix-turn-helix domain-containing protein n=1 Tax=Virgibacillus flavescens TaxID=1611422 RepID=UPI003D336885
MKREWLIKIRNSRRLTQKEVASQAFIDRGYYSQIETGKRNPSHTVGHNIAKVLNFDPLKFFMDRDNYQSIPHTLVNRTVTDHLKSMECGQLLYLYDSIEAYRQHALTFLCSGVEKNSYCFIIDHQENFFDIKHGLESFLEDSEYKKYIFYIDRSEIDHLDLKGIADYFQNLQSKFEDNASIRIWSPKENNLEKDWLSKLVDYINVEKPELNLTNVLFVRSYNASMISAGTHIRLMKTYPYLMTDFEIVSSPFCLSSNNSFIYPSIYIQEHM